MSPNCFSISSVQYNLVFDAKKRYQTHGNVNMFSPTKKCKHIVNRIFCKFAHVPVQRHKIWVRPIELDVVECWGLHSVHAPRSDANAEHDHTNAADNANGGNIELVKSDELFDTFRTYDHRQTECEFRCIRSNESISGRRCTR